MKILTIVGARPQFIKAAAVSRAIREHAPQIQEVLIHTGQHFDSNMSDVFFTEMDIPTPKYNLDIHGLNHGAMTGRMLEGIEGIILDEKPEWVLIYGDTNSTLAGALAASKLHVKIAHVEAGLRSFNMSMPEEVNRIVADRLSSLLLCPTETAVQNLHAEGYKNLETKIIITGDVMLDAAMFYKKTASTKSTIVRSLKHDKFILCTFHRAENTDDLSRLREIVSSLNEVHRNTPVVLPLHPRTKNILVKNGITLDVDVIDPVGYFDMISLLSHCEMVLTDSGGVQKEAYFFEKPCITLRDETEWTELVEVGANILVGAKGSSILQAIQHFTGHHPDYSEKLYGEGKSAQKIIEAILSYK